MEHGQPEYVAPEIVNGEGATFASDMWSVGIITYLLLSGVSPFRGQVSQYLGQTLFVVEAAKYLRKILCLSFQKLYYFF